MIIERTWWVELKCKEVDKQFSWLQGLNGKDNLQIFKVLLRSLYSPSNHFKKSLKDLYTNTLNLNTESLRFFKNLHPWVFKSDTFGFVICCSNTMILLLNSNEGMH